MGKIQLSDTQSLQSKQHIVNIASVPQRSPFRYAGGKTWLVPRIRQWLLKQGGLNKELIELLIGRDLSWLLE